METEDFIGDLETLPQMIQRLEDSLLSKEISYPNIIIADIYDNRYSKTQNLTDYNAQLYLS